MMGIFDELGGKWRSLPRWKQAAALLLALLVGVAGYFLLRDPGDRKVEVVAAENEDLSRPEELVVYVAGAVNRPGIQRLPAGSRIADAIEGAGGPTGEADLEGLNLAQRLSDGMRIHVPRRGQPPNGAPSTGKVNINTASAAELEKLPGIGPTLAQRIVEYREKNGPFRKVEDLRKVKGIGERKFRELRERVEV